MAAGGSGVGDGAGGTGIDRAEGLELDAIRSRTVTQCYPNKERNGSSAIGGVQWDPPPRVRSPDPTVNRSRIYVCFLSPLRIFQVVEVPSCF